ncbi:MAG: AAA family ATPase, partial [Mariprofundaceae bacterium]|nr:AAA family ATPase [Mariprofundaceae bacterium]
MYEKHFGLRHRPYRPTPDIDSYYPATTHENALTQLLQAVSDNEGLMLLMGDAGTGKTLVGHRLLERLDESAATALITNGRVGDAVGLLQAVLYEYALPFAGRSPQEMRLALTDHLLQSYAAGKRNVLVLDEAQHLGPDVLEELRLLGNLEAGDGKAVQFVLVAHEGIWQSLNQPELSAVRQRLAVPARLQPLDIHESADYLVHHLRAVGGRPEAVFTDEALALLAKGAQGIPRLLNQAGHQALILA